MYYSFVSELPRPLPTIVALSTYERSSKGLFSYAEEDWIAETLSTSPMAGATVAGTGGVRKLRVPLQGTGKSGGARLIYYYRGAVGRIYLITAYQNLERKR